MCRILKLVWREQKQWEGKGGKEKEEGVRLKHIRNVASSSTAETFLTTQTRQAEHSPLGLNKLRFIKPEINVTFNEIFQHSPPEHQQQPPTWLLCFCTCAATPFTCYHVWFQVQGRFQFIKTAEQDFSNFLAHRTPFLPSNCSGNWIQQSLHFSRQTCSCKSYTVPFEHCCFKLSFINVLFYSQFLFEMNNRY